MSTHLSRKLSIRLTSLAVGLAMCARSRSARADEGIAAVEGLLDEAVITTASKSLETGAAAPATSSTLTADDMARLGIHSLSEAIDFLSTGVVTSDPLNSVDIGARGVLLPNDRGNHFLLLVNGHAVNEPFYGSAKFDRGAGIPFEIIDHVEVVIGPGSVLYGSNAMLGVINVITKRAAHAEGIQLAAESEILKSYRVAAVAGGETKILGKHAEATLELEYFRQDGPAFQFEPQNLGIDGTQRYWRFTREGPATGIWGGTASHAYYSEIPSGFLRAVWGSWELNLSVSSNKRAMPYSASYESAYKDFDDPENYQRDRSLWLDLRHSANISSIIEASGRVYGDLHDDVSVINSSTLNSCYFIGVQTCRYTAAELSRVGGLELQSSFDWFKTGAFVTLVGADGRIRGMRSKDDLQDYATNKYIVSSYGIIREQDLTLGVYLQQTWQPAPWISLNGGVRLDVERRFDPVPSPRLAMSVNPWRGTTLKGIYSEAFRAPSWYETDFSNGPQIRAGKLTPETVRNVEGLLEQRVGGHRFFFGGFGTRWRDLVSLQVFSFDEVQDLKSQGLLDLRYSHATQFQNLSGIDEFGFDGGLDGVVEGKFRYGASFTGAMARLETKNGDVPLPVAPRLFGNAHVSYDLGGNLPVFGLAAHYVAARPADRSLEGGFIPTPYAPPLAELRATVSGPMPFDRRLSYRLSANYVTAPRGPYVVGPMQSIHSPDPTVMQYVGTAHLNPIDQFRVTVGFTYVFAK